LLVNSAISTSSTITVPDVGSSKPPIIDNSVVFPAPLGPKIPTSSPLVIEIVTYYTVLFILEDFP